MNQLKRRADLSESSTRKLIMFENIIANIMNETSPNSLEMTPELCMKILKFACEVRNKAVHGSLERTAKYQLRDSFYVRDALADIRGLMRAIKRPFGGTLPDEYKGCQLYYDQQKSYFGQLQRICRSELDSREPGKLSFNLAGKYNGLSWVVHCFDKAMLFNDETSASTLYSYIWWFLSVARGWYVAERKALSFKKVTFGQELVEWTDRKQVEATYVTIDNVYRLKNNMPCYGRLICSHHDKVSWGYKPCDGKGCILFILISIAKRIVCDLLKVAKRNPRLKLQPEQGDKGKNVDSYWHKEIATYLLFVMQKTKFLQLKTSKNDNLLFQCDYDDVSLSQVLNVTEEEALNKLPYWIVLPRLTKAQLLLLVGDLNIKLPSKCSKSRKSLCDLLLVKYNEWERVLKDEKTDISDLLQTFCHNQPISLNLKEAKKELSDKIQILVPGDEVIINWITTDCKGFCPIKKQVPGPHSHRMLVTSWLHKCGLLHKKSSKDPRPTRIFSDYDCRTHSLHLRRDSGENMLELCKQLGWKVPPAFSDTGSVVYRRSDAIVTSKEYNTNLISWLQLQYEGRVAAKAGIDWPTIVESLRLNYLQVLKSQPLRIGNDERFHEDLQNTIVAKLSEERLSKVETRLDRIEANINTNARLTRLDIRTIAKDIADVVIESLRSAQDVGQTESWKLKRRKVNSGGKTETSQSQIEEKMPQQ